MERPARTAGALELAGPHWQVPPVYDDGAQLLAADGVPVLDARGTFWVRPGVVVDVRSLGETGGGRLRHPTYVGVRHDLAPDDLWDD